MEQAELLAVGDVGVYGAGMASKDNRHRRQVRALLDRDEATLVYRRETLQSMFVDELEAHS